jgi:hypothetical protein
MLVNPFFPRRAVQLLDFVNVFSGEANYSKNLLGLTSVFLSKSN